MATHLAGEHGSCVDAPTRVYVSSQRSRRHGALSPLHAHIHDPSSPEIYSPRAKPHHEVNVVPLPTPERACTLANNLEPEVRPTMDLGDVSSVPRPPGHRSHPCHFGSGLAGGDMLDDTIQYRTPLLSSSIPLQLVPTHHRQPSHPRRRASACSSTNHIDQMLHNPKHHDTRRT